MSNNKFNFKSMVMGVIVGAGLFGGVVGASTLVAGNVYLSPFPIMANGKSYTATMPILNYNGSTYVPLKELATLTNTDVSFVNSTIQINNKQTTNNTTSNITKPIYVTSSLELEEGDKKTVPVNLIQYGAQSATVSVSDSCIKVSQSYFSTSGNVTVTAQSDGKATLTIKYNTGNIEYITVVVNAEEDEEEIEIGVDSSKNVYIDLNEYDADKAEITITSGKSCISLNKTTFTKSGNLKITGKKEGEAVIKIKYDSDDTQYIYVEVEEDDDEIKVEVDGSKNVYIDLDDYDADEATVTVASGKSYISLNKTTFTKSGNLKITGKKEGDAKIKIEYDSDDTQYIYVEVVEDDEDDDYDYEDFDYEDEISLEKNEYDYIYVDLEEYDADEAEISVIMGKSYITVSRTEVDETRKVKVTGKKEGEAIVLVKYDSGDKEYYWFDVEE